MGNIDCFSGQGLVLPLIFCIPIPKSEWIKETEKESLNWQYNAHKHQQMWALVMNHVGLIWHHYPLGGSPCWVLAGYPSKPMFGWHLCPVETGIPPYGWAQCHPNRWPWESSCQKTTIVSSKFSLKAIGISLKKDKMVVYLSVERKVWPTADMSKIGISGSFHILNEDLYGKKWHSSNDVSVRRCWAKKGTTYFKVPQ